MARPGRYAALSAPSPTRIARVHVAAGQRVAAGAPLVEFEQVAFNAAASGAQAALTAAQRNYERAARLANEGIVPRKDAEQAAADLGAARAAAVTAQRAQQLSVLRSPMSGVVTRMSAVLGASADAGQVLVEIADPSAFDVVLLARADRGGRRAAGRAGHALGRREDRAASRSAPAPSRRSVRRSTRTSRSVAIRVAVTTPRRALRLGESVYGEIAVETRAERRRRSGRGARAGGGRATRCSSSTRAERRIEREVKIGGRTATKVEILEGLTGGETVVTQGAFGVEDSAKVTTPVPAKP